MIYTAAVAATRFSQRGMEIVTAPLQVQASEPEEAQAKALEVAKTEWPKGEYWVGHVAAVRA